DVDLVGALADLRHRDEAGRRDVTLVGALERAVQRRQDLVDDLRLARLARVLGHVLLAGTHEEDVAAGRALAGVDRLLQVDEGLLVDVPPARSAGQVGLELDAAGRRTAAGAGAGGAAGRRAGGPGRARARGSGRA